MTKQILTIIKNCTECPHHSHSGDRTPGGAYLTCQHRTMLKTRGMHWNTRILPINNDKERKYTKEIPNWCPLDDIPIV